MRKKRKYIAAPKCDWCGECNENFVVTANHLYFCREQRVGQPPIKDCHTEYLNNKKELENVRKKEHEEKQKHLLKEKEKIKKEKEIAKPRLNEKLKEFYDQFDVKSSKRTYL